MTTTITDTDAQNAEPKANIRTFRSSPEVENLYRFVSDNNIRREALMIIDSIFKAYKAKEKALKKASKRGRKKKKNLQQKYEKILGDPANQDLPMT